MILSRTRRLGLILLFCTAGFSRSASPADQSKVPVYVGPQMREGFLDVDAGILDSIQDIQEEFGHAEAFTLVRNRGEATLLLLNLA